MDAAKRRKGSSYWLVCLFVCFGNTEGFPFQKLLEVTLNIENWSARSFGKLKTGKALEWRLHTASFPSPPPREVVTLNVASLVLAIQVTQPESTGRGCSIGSSWGQWKERVVCHSPKPRCLDRFPRKEPSLEQKPQEPYLAHCLLSCVSGVTPVAPLCHFWTGQTAQPVMVTFTRPGSSF